MTWSEPQIVLTAVAAFSTLLYTILTAFIWHATWRNTSATRKVLELAHRPYVGVTNVDIAVTSPTSVKLMINISNIGSVPAKLTEFNVILPSLSAEPIKSATPFDTVAVLPGRLMGYREDICGEDLKKFRSPSPEVLIDLKYESMARTQYTYRCRQTYSPSDKAFYIIESKMD